MANYTNAASDSYTTVDTFPNRFVLKTGVVSTVAGQAIIQGTGTLFTSEFVVGDYLFNGTDEVRRVTSIYSDTLMYVDYAFTNPLVGALVKRVQGSRSQQGGLLAVSNGAIWNGITFTAGESQNWGSDLDSNRVIDPIVVDGTGGTVRSQKGQQG
jgi:hypothetical protein